MATTTLQSSITSRIIGERQLGVFSTFMAKQLCANAMFINAQISADFRRSSVVNCAAASVMTRNFPRNRSISRIRCRYSSPNDGDIVSGSFDGGDNDYVNSTVIEAVEVKNGSEGFMIKMRDGRYLRCVYNHPKGGYPPDYISHPAMVLKLEDGSDILLPIIVLEMPSALLIATLRGVPMARPTVYQIVKEMIDTMGYVVKYVRVTKRVQEAYYAELCVMKMGSETESRTFDLRPSDAINIAVRCKAPIQVNKTLALKDGMKIAQPTDPIIRPHFDGSLLAEMDRPGGEPCPESEEFVLLRNMLIAAVEERYQDARRLHASFFPFSPILNGNLLKMHPSLIVQPSEHDSMEGYAQAIQVQTEKMDMMGRIFYNVALWRSIGIWTRCWLDIISFSFAISI